MRIQDIRKSGKQNQKSQKTDLILMGVLCLVMLAEAVHLTAVVTGSTLSFCAPLYALGAGLVAAAVLLLLLGRGKKKSTGGRADREKICSQSRVSLGYRILALTAGLLILFQLIQILAGDVVYLEGDMTLETVNSFLAADGIYRVDPLTGAPYEQGMPLRIKILCLPTLYSILCRLFSMSAETVVFHVVPAFVLVCGYLVYWQLAGIFFSESKEKKVCFLILVALLLYAGDYAYGMDGLGVLYGGFRGVSFRAWVLLPYTVSLSLRGKSMRAFLCVITEACVVWTFYGLGACLFLLAGMYLSGRFLAYRRGQRSEKEGPVCVS